MSAPVKLFILAQVPPAQANAFIRHLRDFDTSHPDCHFEIAADVPDIPLAEAVEMLLVNPALTFVDVFKRENK